MISLNVKFTLSDDSHGPNDVAMHYDKLRDYLNDMGIKSIYYLTKIDGHLITLEIPSILDHPFWTSNRLIANASKGSPSPLPTLPSVPTSPLIRATSPPLASSSRPTSPVASITSLSSKASQSVDKQPKLPGAYPHSSSPTLRQNDIDSSLVSESELVCEGGIIINHDQDERTVMKESQDTIGLDQEGVDTNHATHQRTGSPHNESLEGSYVFDDSVSGSHLDDDDEFVLVDAREALEMGVVP